MKYRVKRYWEVSDTVEVEANSVDEAVSAAINADLTSSPRYVPDSINVDQDIDVEAIEEESQVLDARQLCINSNEHLKECDGDGYCNNCGHQ